MHIYIFFLYIISSFCEIFAILRNLRNFAIYFAKSSQFRYIYIYIYICEIAKISQNCEDFAKLRRFGKILRNCEDFAKLRRFRKNLKLYIYIYIIYIYIADSKKYNFQIQLLFFETYIYIYIIYVRNLVHFCEIFANIESSQRMHAFGYIYIKFCNFGDVCLCLLRNLRNNVKRIAKLRKT